ncbi:hypothetical protein D8S78_05435 [Natrialba swarupiae]|nr:hypothetical protein [Natrialba swarupiae]
MNAPRATTVTDTTTATGSTRPPGNSRRNWAGSTSRRRRRVRRGRVSALESLDETRVRLEVTLPHGEVLEFVLEKPIPWSEEFLLARIVEDVGYDATSISHIVGEGFPWCGPMRGERGRRRPDWKTTTVHAVGDVILRWAADISSRNAGARSGG